LLGWVDKAIENEMTQEHPPVRSKTIKQAGPVQTCTTGVQYVDNICAIIAFALHDVALGPEHFFRRAEVHRYAKHLGCYSMCKPHLIDLGNAIARAEDDVDTIVATHGLTQPVGKGQLSVIPCGAEHL
jgi:hypothetical protein